MSWRTRLGRKGIALVALWVSWAVCASVSRVGAADGVQSRRLGVVSSVRAIVCRTSINLRSYNLTGVVFQERASGNFAAGQTSDYAVYALPCYAVPDEVKEGKCGDSAAVCICRRDGGGCTSAGEAASLQWAPATSALEPSPWADSPPVPVVVQEYVGGKESPGWNSSWNSSLTFRCSVGVEAEGKGIVTVSRAHQGQVDLLWDSVYSCLPFPSVTTSSVLRAGPDRLLETKISAGSDAAVATVAIRDQTGATYPSDPGDTNFTLALSPGNCSSSFGTALLLPYVHNAGPSSAVVGGLWSLRVAAESQSFGWRGVTCAWNVTMVAPDDAPGASTWGDPLIGTVVVSIVPEPFETPSGPGGLTVSQVIGVVAGSAAGIALLAGGITLLARRCGGRGGAASTWRRDRGQSGRRGYLSSDGSYVSAETRSLLPVFPSAPPAPPPSPSGLSLRHGPSYGSTSSDSARRPSTLPSSSRSRASSRSSSSSTSVPAPAPTPAPAAAVFSAYGLEL